MECWVSKKGKKGAWIGEDIQKLRFECFDKKKCNGSICKYRVFFLPIFSRIQGPVPKKAWS